MPDNLLLPQEQVLCRNTTFSGLWWDHGAASVAGAYTSFFTAFKVLLMYFVLCLRVSTRGINIINVCARVDTAVIQVSWTHYALRRSIPLTTPFRNTPDPRGRNRRARSRSRVLDEQLGYRAQCALDAHA